MNRSSGIIVSPARESIEKQQTLNAGLIEAAESGKVQEARTLLSQGARADGVVKGKGRRPHYGIMYDNSAREIAAQKKDGSMLALFQEQDAKDEALLSAVKCEDLHGAKTALESGAHPDARDGDWKTPLMLAMWTKNGNLEMTKLLAPVSDTNARVYRAVSKTNSHTIVAPMPTAYYALANSITHQPKSDATAKAMMQILVENKADVNVPLAPDSNEYNTVTWLAGVSGFNQTHNYLMGVGGTGRIEPQSWLRHRFYNK